MCGMQPYTCMSSYTTPSSLSLTTASYLTQPVCDQISSETLLSGSYATYTCMCNYTLTPPFEVMLGIGLNVSIAWSPSAAGNKPSIQKGSWWYILWLHMWCLNVHVLWGQIETLECYTLGSPSFLDYSNEGSFVCKRIRSHALCSLRRLEETYNSRRLPFPIAVVYLTSLSTGLEGRGILMEPSTLLSTN